MKIQKFKKTGTKGRRVTNVLVKRNRVTLINMSTKLKVKHY